MDEYQKISDSSILISNCKCLLNPKGLLYSSFVTQDYRKSGYISSCTGDRVYFYYHNLENIKSELAKYSFKKTKLFSIHYKKSNGSREMKSILITKNINNPLL
ncbi:hypothetical protein GCM10023163_09060 [Aestuariibaculum suncheonense]